MTMMTAIAPIMITMLKLFRVRGKLLLIIYLAVHHRPVHNAHPYLLYLHYNLLLSPLRTGPQAPTPPGGPDLSRVGPGR